MVITPVSATKLLIWTPGTTTCAPVESTIFTSSIMYFVPSALNFVVIFILNGLSKPT